MKILTFDIEEWFHLLDTNSSRNAEGWNSMESRIHKNVDRILKALQGSNHKATFFCLGWVAKKHPDIIKKIDAMGFEIGSHSSLHQLVFEQGEKAFRQDLVRSIYSLEDILGKKVTVFRAPGFSIGSANPWAFEVLSESGIEIDCSVFPAQHGHGGFKEFGQAKPSIVSVNGKTIKEFPINLFSRYGKKFIFSGGGYFRLLPYPVLLALFKRSEYCMSYFHPRDFDAMQPMLPDLPLRRKFKSYYGLSSAFSKLEKLMKEFEFIDVSSAAMKVDWTKAPVVTL